MLCIMTHLCTRSLLLWIALLTAYGLHIPASHMMQCGDQHRQSMHPSTSTDMLQIVDINALPDPCPLPHTVKKRGLNDKERLLYAPMADVGGLLYDKDAVYIDIPDWKVHPWSSPSVVCTAHLIDGHLLDLL